MELASHSRNGDKCPICGQGTLHDSVREESVEYRGRTFKSREPGAYCDVCHDGIAYPNPTGEQDWVAFRARVDQEEREELVRIRTRLGLTQQQASKISGGGHNAFSRYERGEAQPVLGVVHLFRLLNSHPQLLLEVGLRPFPKFYTGVATIGAFQVPQDNLLLIYTSTGGTQSAYGRISGKAAVHTIRYADFYVMVDDSTSPAVADVRPLSCWTSPEEEERHASS
jgi:HTH-type transcriptional regulator / antitoxin MqsA